MKHQAAEPRLQIPVPNGRAWLQQPNEDDHNQILSVITSIEELVSQNCRMVALFSAD
jgi:hypothetical protein